MMIKEVVSYIMNFLKKTLQELLVVGQSVVHLGDNRWRAFGSTLLCTKNGFRSSWDEI